TGLSFPREAETEFRGNAFPNRVWERGKASLLREVSDYSLFLSRTTLSRNNLWRSPRSNKSPSNTSRLGEITLFCRRTLLFIQTANFLLKSTVPRPSQMVRSSTP